MEIQCSWQDMKDWVTLTGKPLKYFEKFPHSYFIFTYDKDGVMYSHCMCMESESNAADRLEFETNYKPYANKPWV